MEAVLLLINSSALGSHCAALAFNLKTRISRIPTTVSRIHHRHGKSFKLLLYLLSTSSTVIVNFLLLIFQLFFLHDWFSTLQHTVQWSSPCYQLKVIKVPLINMFNKEANFRWAETARRLIFWLRLFVLCWKKIGFWIDSRKNSWKSNWTLINLFNRLKFFALFTARIGGGKSRWAF